MRQNLLRVAFHTLGCKLNYSETSTIARSLPDSRFVKVGFNEEADLYVINTCSVTDTAERKCRQAVKKITNRYPEAFIAVIGCYAQLNPEEIARISGVDLILGTNEKYDLVNHISKLEKRGSPDIFSCDISAAEKINPSWSAGGRTRSFLKVQDGCDYHCSYCTIPLARGKSRNIPIEECIREAKEIAGRGIEEIVITGINTGDYGKTTGESFIDMLIALSLVKEIKRYRISSIEPNLISDKLISTIADSSVIMPHFHIPLQSGCNSTLARMKRRYNREVFAEKVNAIITAMPHAGIGTDVITGFPGETDEEFEQTYSFIKNLPLAYMHIFRFSERPATEAANLKDKVPEKIKEERSRKLILLSEKKSCDFRNSNTGRTEEVLFEKTEKKELATGLTTNYIRVLVPSVKDLAGTIKRVRLIAPTATGEMRGEISE